MVLKSPKGIYMQLESGKIIAIKTSFKGDAKDNPIGKKGAILIQCDLFINYYVIMIKL